MTLPQRLFLLSHRTDKGRLDDDSAAVRGSLLRACAVAELRLAGLLHDQGGKAERINAPAPERLDPFLGQVLDDVRAGTRRGWFDLVNRKSGEAEDAVRAGLLAAGVITVEQRRILGVIPAQRIGVVDPGLVEVLRDRVRAAALNEGPVAIEDAVLAVLAIDGNVSTVFGWRKPAVRALGDRIDRELPGLRPAATAAIAVHRSPA